MKLAIFALLFTVVVFVAESSFCEEMLSCTIEKSLTTGLVLENPLVSTEKIKIEAKPFGKNYIFPLSPADAECELRVPNPKGGTFLNCWTTDKKHGFRSDRTIIDERKGITNTLTYADSKKQLVIQIKVRCE
jgi:hypothetical protein